VCFAQSGEGRKRRGQGNKAQPFPLGKGSKLTHKKLNNRTIKFVFVYLNKKININTKI